MLCASPPVNYPTCMPSAQTALWYCTVGTEGPPSYASWSGVGQRKSMSKAATVSWMQG